MMRIQVSCSSWSSSLRVSWPIVCGLVLFDLLVPQASVEALDNGFGSSPPPMGWNSWNAFVCQGLNEKVIFETANKIVDLGLDQLGYRYVNLDDCWMALNRTSEGKLTPDLTRFPRGIKFVADYLHNQLNLQFGIYSSAGTATCAGRPASLYYEHLDAQSFADWGVDYLKYDNCNTDNIPAIDRYTAMRDALNATGRPILYALCQWGVDDSWRWASSVANVWRTTMDIRPHWLSIITNFWESYVLSQKVLPSSKAKSWMDPDMLEVGNGELTYQENKAHFSLWCLTKAPLLLGNDLTKLTDQTLQIISNRRLIAINQDLSSPQATCFFGCSVSLAEYREKDEANNNSTFPTWSVFATTTSTTASSLPKSTSESVVMLVMNWSNDTLSDLTLAGQDVGVVPGPDQLVVLTDLWGEDEPILATYDYQSLKSISIPPLLSHDCVVYRLTTIHNTIATDDITASTNTKMG